MTSVTDVYSSSLVLVMNSSQSFHYIICCVVVTKTNSLSFLKTLQRFLKVKFIGFMQAYLSCKITQTLTKLILFFKFVPLSCAVGVND